MSVDGYWRTRRTLVDDSRGQDLTYCVVNDQGLLDMHGDKVIESASGTWHVCR